MQKQNLTIGITINDVLRKYSEKFISVYNHHYCSDNSNIANVEILSDDTELEGVEFVDNSNSSKTPLSIENFNPFLLKNYFLSAEEAEHFLSEVVFELNGVADECYKNCMLELNNISEVLLSEGIELVLISDEVGKTRSATFHFLSKTLCQVGSVKFFKNKMEYFEYCDYIVTSDPDLIQPKYIIGVDLASDNNLPNVFEIKSNIIKIQRSYNDNIESKFTLKEINELPKIIDKLK